MTLKVKFNDGTERDVEAKFADFVSFERTWNRSVARFETDLRLTDLAWLAWSAETRNNKTGKKFDPEWLETVDSIEPIDNEGGKTVPLETTP